MGNIEIPGFEIIEKIGAGGMASVWKARQVSLDRIVAVKILYSKFASDPADVQRFQKEAQAAARLKHPGIVQVYDANALGGMYYFIMEYVAGYTVGEWIKRKTVLPVGEALLVAECVADALGYAWNEAGIIHCDIKPDNVLVDADGSVKVSDLGLARTLSHIMQDGGSDDIMGTPAYIAPEQALGAEPLDFRADIYSLGAMLYHMLTGQIPFAGHPPETVMDLQVNDTLPDPIDVNPEVPSQVAWLVEKLMCKDPAGRQASWEEVRQDLERVKKGLRPLGEALPEGVSTVERSASRSKVTRTAADLLTSRRPDGAGSWVRLAVVLVLAAGGLWLFLAWNQGKLDGLLARLGGGGQSAGEVVQESQSLDDQWEEDYQHALAWFVANPGRYDEAIAMLSRLATEATGTPYAGMAKTRVEALRREKQQRVEGVMTQLTRAAEPLVAAMDFLAAAEFYESYAGEWAAETQAQRAQRGTELRARAEAALKVVPITPLRPLEAVLNDVTGQVLAGKFTQAVSLVDAALADPGLASESNHLERLKAEVDGARLAEVRILDSFARQKGKQVKVQLRTGPRELNVRDVRNGKIIADVYRDADTMPTHGTIEFDVRYLQYNERLRRMGPSDFPGAALYMGLMAVEAGSTTSARRYFAQTSPLIADRLSAKSGQ